VPLENSRISRKSRSPCQIISADLLRGGPPNKGGFTYSDLMKDFVSATDSKNSAPYLNVVLDGLLAGHTYDITFFEFDAGAQAGAQRTDWFLADAKKPFTRYSYDSSNTPV
jgi:hypothetical protein